MADVAAEVDVVPLQHDPDAAARDLADDLVAAPAAGVVAPAGAHHGGVAGGRFRIGEQDRDEFPPLPGELGEHARVRGARVFVRGLHPRFQVSPSSVWSLRSVIGPPVRVRASRRFRFTNPKKLVQHLEEAPALALHLGGRAGDMKGYGRVERLGELAAGAAVLAVQGGRIDVSSAPRSRGSADPRWNRRRSSLDVLDRLLAAVLGAISAWRSRAARMMVLAHTRCRRRGRGSRRSPGTGADEPSGISLRITAPGSGPRGGGRRCARRRRERRGIRPRRGRAWPGRARRWVSDQVQKDVLHRIVDLTPQGRPRPSRAEVRTPSAGMYRRANASRACVLPAGGVLDQGPTGFVGQGARESLTKRAALEADDLGAVGERGAGRVGVARIDDQLGAVRDLRPVDALVARP